MADVDLDVAEFAGWLALTAKLNGWTVVRSEHYGTSGATTPDLILFRDRVLGVKVKSVKAVRASGARENGGLTDNQAKFRDGISRCAGFFVWTPEDAGEALSVLTAPESDRDRIVREDAAEAVCSNGEVKS